MPICETVSLLARQLEEQLSNITPSQSNMLALLQEMPRYRERDDLRAWSAGYKACRNENEKSDPNYRAIELVYEIGRYNVSTEFDEEGTHRLYCIAILQLGQRNVVVSQDLDVSRL